MAALRPFGGRVFFDHLPKTAGTAVNAWLMGELGAGCVTASLNGEHRTLIQEYGGLYSVISAHVAFRGEGLDPRYQYITCFREPIDRAVSWLFFVKNNRTEALLGDLWTQTCRFLESDGDELGFDLGGHLSNVYVDHFARIFGLLPQVAVEKRNAAMAAIERYDAWGLHEDLPGFMADVAGLIGLPAPIALPQVNVTSKRPSVTAISPKLRQRLLELNVLDLELYDLLRQRLLRRQKPQPAPPLVSMWEPLPPMTERERVFSAPGFCLLSLKMDGDGRAVPWQVLTFTLEFSLDVPIAELEIGIHVFDEHHRWAFGTNTTLLDKKILNAKRGTHRLQYHLGVDLPAGDYTVGFAFSDRQADAGRELGWFDALVGFGVALPRPQACVGYASMPVAVTHSQTSDAVPRRIEDAVGTVRIAALLGDLVPGEALHLPVMLENASSQIWIGSHFHPIVLSYHWFDMHTNAAIFEGERTPLPVNELHPGQTVPVSMRVIAPATPGQYQLHVMPVQEGHAWFDQFGFTAAVLELVVLPPTASRRYPGADARLASHCGRREGSTIFATGQEGFLVFGPYAHFPVGRYVARLQGTFARCAPGAQLDVVSAGGAMTLARVDICSASANESEVSVGFQLTDACNDLEVRLWVPANTHAAIEALLMEPVNLCDSA